MAECKRDEHYGKSLTLKQDQQPLVFNLEIRTDTLVSEMLYSHEDIS